MTCGLPADDYLIDSVQEPSMMQMGQSRKDSLSRMRTLAQPKIKLRLGTWNVRTMFQVGKTKQIVNEMINYNIDILGVAESRWTLFGEIKTTDDYHILFSGDDVKHEKGVALVISKRARKSLLDWQPVNNRIIKASFYSKYAKLTVIQAYAPTNDADEELKIEFYDKLQEIVNKTPKHNLLILMGDFNAKVGKRIVEEERAVGDEAIGQRNENGELFVSFCEVNNLIIGGSYFKHKNIHKGTWTSPDGKTTNQIDHIAINGIFKRSLQDVRVKRGADVASDHFLVLAVIKLKLAKNMRRKESERIKYNIQKLKDKKFKKDFTMELKNRFEALANVDENGEQEEGNTEWIWHKCNETFNSTAKEILGVTEKIIKKEWITANTLKLINERKKLKGKINNCKSERLLIDYQKKYWEIHRNVKYSARTDKRNHLRSLAEDAQRANDVGDTGGVYKIIKQLSGNYRKSECGIKDRNNKLLSQDGEIQERWREHFEELLNVDHILTGSDIDSPFNEEVDELEIDLNEITNEEIKVAIKMQKSGKACGNDNLNAELFKADPEVSANSLNKLFNSIWTNETIPKSWKEAQIVKIPKKGDLTDCNNWRGISLLSVPSKLFTRVLMNRIKKSIEKRLRIEQAGFRGGRSTMNQIFILRNIIEQTIEFNSTLYMNFIDFAKAFDSINRDCLWKILKIYGLPQKIINIVYSLYDGSNGRVLVNGNATEKFDIKSGVRQGCVLSGLLFNIVIDWTMRQTLKESKTGIRWNFDCHLEDLDYADDIVLLASNFENLKVKTSKLEENAKRIGLQINESKTKLIKINNNKNEKIFINGKEIEEVQHFTYLGANISTEGGTNKDIDIRIKKAQLTYKTLNKIWRSSNIQTKLKLKIFTSTVRAVLLYGSSTWKLTKQQEHQLDTFQTKCLRKILKIFWPNKISNEDLYKRTNCKPITAIVKKQRWTWVGHILRMIPSDPTRIALTWAPDGRRKRGRPKLTWRQMIIKERNIFGWQSWGTAREAALDRKGWNALLVASCAT